MEEYAKRLMASNWRPANIDMEAQKQHRLDAVSRAEQLVTEARKEVFLTTGTAREFDSHLPHHSGPR
jgi:hypothetical protein